MTVDREQIRRDERVETVAREFHAVYQAEAKRQGDVRHHDDYDALAENVKEFDRVLARHVLAELEQTERERDTARMAHTRCEGRNATLAYKAAKANKLAEAAKLVAELDQRERAGDETLDGFEWGRATTALRAALADWESE